MRKRPFGSEDRKATDNCIGVPLGSAPMGTPSAGGLGTAPTGAKGGEKAVVWAVTARGRASGAITESAEASSFGERFAPPGFAPNR